MMKRTTKILLMTMAMLISIPAWAGFSIDIKSKESFAEGEYVTFEYTITSDADKKISFYPHISCGGGNMLIPAIVTRTADVGPSKPYSSTYSSGVVVDERTDSQKCKAQVFITFPEKVRSEKIFQIVTKPSLNLVVNSCMDSECRNMRRTFTKDSTIYLRATGEEAPSASASIVYPDGTKETIKVPGTFAASQTGKYMIDLSAEKEGYKKYKSAFEISVIEAPVTIPYADFSTKAGQPVTRPVYENTQAEAPPAEAPPVGAGESKGGCSLIPQSH